MKPYFFVKDVIEQLSGFNVTSIDFELHLGGNGLVGSGDSILEFTVNVEEYRAERVSGDMKEILGGEQA